MMLIHIEPLKKACLSLRSGLQRSEREPNDLEVRDACIQRFEYTFELCIRIMKRYIEREMPPIEQVDQMNFRDLLRVAVEIGLIEQIEHWFQYREARNQTSHSYDENKAKAVYQVLAGFVQDANFLITQLELRLPS